ncbi:MAG TPA: hypothetical protein VNK26_05020 [Pyrinomonadaceae bacterium]|nr:hypothetical protein [Pyrinomonadaceae bacterium]
MKYLRLLLPVLVVLIFVGSASAQKGPKNPPPKNDPPVIKPGEKPPPKDNPKDQKPKKPDEEAILLLRKDELVFG